MLYGISSFCCPECMKGMWLISLKYDYLISDSNRLLSATTVKCFAGTAEQAVRACVEYSPANVCLARNGIMYTFEPVYDDTVNAAVSVAADSDEVPGLDDSWELETFTGAYISWEYDGLENIYRIRCAHERNGESQKAKESVILYNAEGKCLGPEIRK